MENRLAVLFLISALFAWAPAAAAPADGDVERGEQVAERHWCYRCHGDGGVAENPHVPHLAGQRPNYIAIQILYFQQEPPSEEGGGRSYRTHRSMGYNARRLEPREIDDVAAYYAAQPCRRTAEPVDRPPPPASAIEQCEPCHGADGKSRFDQVPNLAGQNFLYLVSQLNHFAGRDGSDADLRGHPIMERVAKALTPDEIEAVAAHFANRECR